MDDFEAARLKELAAWIEGSAFATESGPVTLYHGTDTDEPFNIFTRCDEASVGFHFGEARVASDRLKIIHRMDENSELLGSIVPVFCRATDPLEVRDHFMWDLDSVAGELESLGLVSEAQVEAIIESCDEAYLFAAIELAGHDCLTYRNECEFKDESTVSLLIWRAELLKSPFASGFDRADPRLMPQIATADADMRSWSYLAERIEAAKAELTLLAGPAPGI